VAVQFGIWECGFGIGSFAAKVGFVAEVLNVVSKVVGNRKAWLCSFVSKVGFSADL
jgi:hypothetical protein